MESELESLRNRIEKEVTGLDSEGIRSASFTPTLTQGVSLPTYTQQVVTVGTPQNLLSSSTKVVLEQGERLAKDEASSGAITRSPRSQVSKRRGHSSTSSKGNVKSTTSKGQNQTGPSIERRPSILYKLPSNRKTMVSGIELERRDGPLHLGEHAKVKLSLDVQLKPTGETLDEHELHFRDNFLKIVKQKETLDQAIGNIESSIRHTLLREDLSLKMAYQPREKEAKSEIRLLEQRARRLEEQNKANITYRQVLSEREKFQQTADTLRNKLQQLHEQLAQEQSTHSRLKEENAARHLQLYKASRRNLALSYQIEELLEQLQQARQARSSMQPTLTQPSVASPQNKSFGRPFLTAAMAQTGQSRSRSQLGPNESIYARESTRYPDFNPNLLPQEQLEEVLSMVATINDLEREIGTLRAEKKHHIASQYSKLVSSTDLQRLFSECFAAYERDILKKQEMPRGGLEGETQVHNPAFFFELKKRAFSRLSGPLPQNNPTPALERIKSKYPVGVLDLQLKDVIYGTLKSLAAAAKENKKRAHILSVGLEWGDFNHFTPSQIVGLLLLRDDGLRRLQQSSLPSLSKS